MTEISIPKIKDDKRNNNDIIFSHLDDGLKKKMLIEIRIVSPEITMKKVNIRGTTLAIITKIAN